MPSFGLDMYDYVLTRNLRGYEVVVIQADSNSDTKLYDITEGVDKAKFRIFLEGMERQVKSLTVSTMASGNPVVVLELLDKPRTDFNRFINEKVGME